MFELPAGHHGVEDGCGVMDYDDLTKKRKFRVVANGSTSDEEEVMLSVLQGADLATKLFCNLLSKI